MEYVTSLTLLGIIPSDGFQGEYSEANLCTYSLLYGKWIPGQQVHNHTYSE